MRKLVAIGMLGALGCGGAEFALGPADGPPDGSPEGFDGGSASPDGPTPIPDAPDGRVGHVGPPDAGASPDASVDGSNPDANPSLDGSTPDANPGPDVGSSDASRPALCCHLAAPPSPDLAVVSCAMTSFTCCSGPLVNCDGGVCAGTCSGTATTCAAPKCAMDSVCEFGAGYEGTIAPCP